ncbi:MAG TPA: hypothetical protein VNW06_10645 [Cytophagaceae bacterium]|jgi:hypothetical protein|nr:hypothetical protein [Cytophagaceae bacterium]
MIKTTTQNELILTIYRETSEKSQKDFHTECIINSILSEEKEAFEQIKGALDQLSFRPRQKSIENILKYSASFMTS